MAILLNTKTSLLAATAIFASLSAGSAFAQDNTATALPEQTANPNANPNNNSEPASGNQDEQPADIIVTANKREERIQDVALSISAVSGAELQRRQVQDIQDLAQQVPGVSFIRSGSIAGNGNNIILRGLNTGSGGATVASAVDDAPLSFSVGLGSAGFATDFEPWDLQRVEVLRGPQGSLYGATAEGGLIKYITNAPDPARTSAGFDVGLFDLAHGGLGGSGKGYLNVPIAADTAAIRISGYYQDSPGWINNELGGRTDDNGFRRYGGRASLLVKPTERLTVRATAMFQNLKSDGFDAIEVRGLLDPSNPFKPINGYNLDTFLPQPSSSKAQLYIGNIGYDFGRVGLQSITSYGKLDNFRTNDVPLYGQVFGGFLFGRPNTTLYYEVDGNLTKFNQEVRLFSQNDAAAVGRGLQWQLGAFYTDESIDALGNYFTKDQTTGENVITPFGGTSAQVLQSNTRQKYREKAAYADFTYFFSPKFDLEVGGRIFNNRQRQSVTQGGPFLGTPLGVELPDQKSGETSYTFAVSPRFHFNRDVMAYARVASGYRPGGPQSFVPNAPPGLPTEYKADKTINYEAGVKGTFLDGRLSADVAAFYVDWRDVQITVFFPSGGVVFPVTGNAGRAVSKGLEWTFVLRPVRGLSLTWLGAYTDATLTRDAPGIFGAKGDRLPYVPKFSTTFNANYDFPVANDIRGLVGASWSHRSSQYNSYSFFPTLSHLKVPGYDTLSGELGLRRGNFGLLLYGKNLTDKRGITFYYAGQSGDLALGGNIPGQIGLIRPREIGLRLTGNF